MSSEASSISVGVLYEQITDHLESRFGRGHEVWVRGEITKIYEKGHCYIDLSDVGAKDARRATLNAHAWQTGWVKIKATLASAGVTLAPGMVVSVRGFIDLYAPQGRIGFTVLDVDPSEVLGDLAKQRQELIEKLKAHELFDKNRLLGLPPVALRIGLVASRGTEGFSDFVGQLTASGFKFFLDHRQATVQGESAPEEIVRGITELAGTVDVIAIVRGGGSKSDLACFDDERIAMAIVNCPTPVITGIGHTGDESVADLVAAYAAITPTQLGVFLAGRLNEWYDAHVVEARRRVREGAERVLEEASTMLAINRRAVVFAARDRLRAERRHLHATRSRLKTESGRVLSDAAARLTHARQLLVAYDPSRRLAQGWSIATDAEGRVVTSLEQLAAGDTLNVRVTDGTLESTVTKKVGNL